MFLFSNLLCRKMKSVMSKKVEYSPYTICKVFFLKTCKGEFNNSVHLNHFFSCSRVALSHLDTRVIYEMIELKLLLPNSDCT